MILYEYRCSDCGKFEAWNIISKSSDPVECPTCAKLSKRQLSAIFLADMDNNNRIAHQRNEKSAHEPEVVRREAPSQESEGKGKPHSHNHGDHGHRHHHAPSRPWMIGH